jgi:hypothetical protein
MYNPNKISSVQKFSKKGMTIGILLGLFMGIAFASYTPVKAYTNQFVLIGSLNCQTCSIDPNVTGTIANANDLLVVVYQCSSTSFTVNTITDTKTLSWSQITTFNFQSSTIYSSLTGIIGYWFASAGSSTGSDTLTITFGSAPTDCIFLLIEGNTPYVAYSSSFSSGGITQSSSQPNNIISTQSVPANSIVLINMITFFSTNINYQSSSYTVLPPTQSGSYLTMCQSSVSCNTEDTYGALFYGYWYTTNPVTTGLGYQSPAESYYNATPAYLYGLIFSTTGTISVSQSNLVTYGCTSTNTPTSGSSSTSVTGNETYWFTGYTAGSQAGSLFDFRNMTLWVNSIGLTNHQTKVDIYIVLWISSNVGTTPQGQLPSATFPFQQSYNYPSQAGGPVIGTTQLISIQHYTNTTNPFKISVGSNAVGTILASMTTGQAFAIGLYTTHNGVKITNCTTATPQYYDVPSSYYNTIISESGIDIGMSNCVSSTLCMGPLLSATTNSLSPYLYTQILTPSIITVQTSTNTILTITSFSTVTLTSTSGVATNTITVTTTIITDALQGPTGSVQITENLITYWPIWILPLVFGFMGGLFGFGLGGLLYGLMIGLMLGQLEGLLPLWTIFIDAVMIYLILRR